MIVIKFSFFLTLTLLKASILHMSGPCADQGQSETFGSAVSSRSALFATGQSGIFRNFPKMINDFDETEIWITTFEVFRIVKVKLNL
jgi:hypothetical protein